jgi:hypothetical protein
VRLVEVPGTELDVIIDLPGDLVDGVKGVQDVAARFGVLVSIRVMEALSSEGDPLAFMRTSER